MAIMSVGEARRYLKDSTLSDEKIQELIELLEEIAWMVWK